MLVIAVAQPPGEGFGPTLATGLCQLDSRHNFAGRTVNHPHLSDSAMSHSLQAAHTYFGALNRDPLLHAIRAGHVQGFLEWRRTHTPDGKTLTSPLSSRSLAKDRATLHALFSYAERLDLIEANPVSRTDVPRGDSREPVILSEDEYERLVHACKDNPMLRTYVLVLGETGLRCDSEALWIRWKDLDFGSRLLKVEGVRKGRRTKSGRSRMDPLTDRLTATLKEHAANYRMALYHGQRTQWVFHHLTDRRRATAGERLKSLRRGFQSAVKRANLPVELNQHDLRHRRCTEWLRQGHPAHLVQKALGHADLRTTMAYEDLVANDLLALVEVSEPGGQERFG